MKNIVITGATSFIGVYLINEWLKDDCEIYAVCRPQSRNLNRIPKKGNIHVVECNINNYEELVQQIPKGDYFFHLAWEGARKPWRDEESIQRNNYICALNAMNVAIRLGCTFFLGTGSQAEYGKTEQEIDESFPCNPCNAYGKYKLQTYLELNKIAKKSNIRFVWTRIFSVYGKYDFPDTLVMSLIDKMKKNYEIELTECTQFWDYLYVEDATRAMKMFADNSNVSGMFNLGFGISRPLKDYVLKVKEILRSQSVLRFGAVPYGSDGKINLKPSVKKINNELNWIPEIKFEEGISKIIEL